MVTIPSPRTSSNLNSIELNFLALESLKRVWEVSEGSLEVSEKSLGGFWAVSGRFLEVSRRSLKGRGLQEASEGPGLKK